ncbi:MAG: DUF2480 family protein [Bacteroidota bacterium]|nr:DUF2480 family protein [Bacteroidota bacterium]
MEDTIVNKVAQSTILTLNLERFYPGGEIVVFDLKNYLYMELILKEKEFRESLKSVDWSAYQEKNVAIGCSADAIIPLWAYMLITAYLQPVAKEIIYGSKEELFNIIFLKNIWKTDVKEFDGKRVVVKGCGDKKIPEIAFVEITKMLRPVAKSIMYGEPCSTVPIFKQNSKMI